jgi:hypothetical protein
MVESRLASKFRVRAFDTCRITGDEPPEVGPVVLLLRLKDGTANQGGRPRLLDLW